MSFNRHVIKITNHWFVRPRENTEYSICFGLAWIHWRICQRNVRCYLPMCAETTKKYLILCIFCASNDDCFYLWKYRVFLFRILVFGVSANKAIIGNTVIAPPPPPVIERLYWKWFLLIELRDRSLSMTGVGVKEKLLSLHFFSQPMSIWKIYLPIPVKMSNFFTQPKEKMHI